MNQMLFNQQPIAHMDQNLHSRGEDKELVFQKIKEQHLFQDYCNSSLTKSSANFHARLTYGNKTMRGIKNCHLNIRSLMNKISEVKVIVKEQKPHIFGLS